MKKSKITIGIVAAAVVIALIICVLLLGGDSTGPVITVPSDLQYRSGMTDDELLAGVTAVDNKDGDVSDTLIVKSVIELSDGNNVKITYAAQDSSNNISVKSITLPYDEGGRGNTSADDGETSGEDVSEENPGDETDDTTDSISDNQPGETTSAYPEETTPVETESAEAPVLYLTQIEDWIQKGSEVNWIRYVDDITDDKDDRNSLFQSIMIEDYPDMNTVGDYDMKFYCKDSDGNFSPRVTLHIHITD